MKSLVAQSMPKKKCRQNEAYLNRLVSRDIGMTSSIRGVPKLETWRTLHTSLKTFKRKMVFQDHPVRFHVEVGVFDTLPSSTPPRLAAGAMPLFVPSQPLGLQMLFQRLSDAPHLPSHGHLSISKAFQEHLAMGQKPNRTPSEHPNPTTKID